jgi:hypothetical protein
VLVSLDEFASVDGEADAGDVASVVGVEEHHGVGDVHRLDPGDGKRVERLEYRCDFLAGDVAGAVGQQLAVLGRRGGLLLGRRSYWLGMSRCGTAQQRCVDSPWCDARSIICHTQMVYAAYKACLSHTIGRFALSSS